MSAEGQIALLLHQHLGSVVEIDVCESIADALMPLIDRLRAEAAAEALDVAADEFRNGPHITVVPRWLRDRAIALRAWAGA